MLIAKTSKIVANSNILTSNNIKKLHLRVILDFACAPSQNHEIFRKALNFILDAVLKWFQQNTIGEILYFLKCLDDAFIIEWFILITAMKYHAIKHIFSVGLMD